MTTRTVIRAAGLHPADIAARHAILARLAELRTTERISQTTIGAALGITADGVRLAEQATADPALDRLQRHLRALRHRLVLNPQFDPDLPADTLTTMFRAMADTTVGEQGDTYHRSAVLRHLIARRRWLGLSARDVSTTLGRSHSWLGQIEADTRPPMLSTYQLYTRALGGVLRLDLEPLPINQTEGATP